MPAKPLRPKCRHGDHRHAVVACVGNAPLSNHDRLKRRRGILGGRIGEHFPLQRLEISRSIVCFRITQLDLDGSHPHRSSVSLSLLKRSRYAAMVLSSGPASPYEASFMSVLYVTAWLSFMVRARKRPCASSGDHAICEITPFSMLFLRYFQCSFYAMTDVVFTPYSLKVLRLSSLARSIPSITSERAWLSPLAHLGKRNQLGISPVRRSFLTSLRKAAF